METTSVYKTTTTPSARATKKTLREREYYQLNRERSLARKREMYATNPDLKERKKAESLKRYYTIKNEKATSLIFSIQ